MSTQLDELPLLGERGGLSARGMAAGEMMITLLRFPGGTDFRALSPDSSCPSSHWGLVLEGTVHFELADGTVETAGKDSTYYVPPGHRPWFDEDTTLFEISPAQEMTAALLLVQELLDAAASA